jgi:hypothetical protein
MPRAAARGPLRAAARPGKIFCNGILRQCVAGRHGVSGFGDGLNDAVAIYLLDVTLVAAFVGLVPMPSAGAGAYTRFGPLPWRSRMARLVPIYLGSAMPPAATAATRLRHPDQCQSRHGRPGLRRPFCHDDCCRRFLGVALNIEMIPTEEEG